MPKLDSGGTAFATHHDVKAILGNIDPAQLLPIMSLKPTSRISNKHPCGLKAIPTFSAPASR